VGGFRYYISLFHATEVMTHLRKSAILSPYIGKDAFGTKKLIIKEKLIFAGRYRNETKERKSKGKFRVCCRLHGLHAESIELCVEEQAFSR
jgi:hypothetical protein